MVLELAVVVRGVLDGGGQRAVVVVVGQEVWRES